jgi:hypothetical protein
VRYLAPVLAVALALLCKPVQAQDITVTYADALMDGAVVIDEESLTCLYYDDQNAFGWALPPWSSFVDPFANTVTCESMGVGEYILAGGALDIGPDAVQTSAPITVTAPIGYLAFVGVPAGSTAPPLSDVFTAAGYVELARFYVVRSQHVYIPIGATE